MKIFMLILVVLSLNISCTYDGEIESSSQSVTKIDTLENVDGNIQVDRVGYYDSGSKKYEMNYLNGKKHGISRWFYPSGNIKVYCNWYNGKRKGENIIYFPNGNVEYYQFFIDKEELLFRRKYNETNKIEYEEGDYYSFTSEEKGDSLYVFITLATPPHTQIDFYIDCDKKDLKNGNLTTVVEIPEKGKVEYIELLAQVKVLYNNDSNNVFKEYYINKLIEVI